MSDAKGALALLSLSARQRRFSVEFKELSVQFSERIKNLSDNLLGKPVFNEFV